jgi:3-methyladenine DNA glycosylase/8-oxoguanine DNA glycosylase
MKQETHGDRPASRQPNEERSAKSSWTTKKIADELKKIFAEKGAQLDRNAKLVLDRLMLDERVPEALVSILKIDSDLTRVLQSCFEYEEIARTFNETMAKEREIIERTKKLKNSVDELTSFLDQDISNPGRMEK